MAMLELQNVHSYYGHIHALKGVTLTVDKGEIVTLIGANGAGKTTTLKTISGVMHPHQGSITLNGEPIEHSGARNCCQGNRPISGRTQNFCGSHGPREFADGRVLSHG